MIIKKIELLGVVLAIAGSYIAAMGNFALGYPIWTISSICLAYTAYKDSNYNLLLLQSVFICADLVGVYKNTLTYL